MKSTQWKVLGRVGLLSADIRPLIDGANFVQTLVLLQWSKRTSWLSGDSEWCNSLTGCHWSHKIAYYFRGLHLLLNCRSFVVWLDWGITFMVVTLFTLAFSRPAALRMVTDVARIQCDVKWVDRPAFFSRGRVNCPSCASLKGHCSTTQRRFNWIWRCCGFLAFATRLGSWGFAFANTSLYIWLDIFLDYLATHTLWLASCLRCVAARMIFCGSLSKGSIFQAVCGFSENNIFLYHILWFSGPRLPE